jgi:adenylate cyclase
MITRDYVAYMTSNSVLLGAEFDKMVSILMVATILGIALIRGRALLVRAVSEGAAARELSRFFAPEVAERIRGAEQEVAVGSGELREAAILNLDLRGFTRFAKTRNPDQVMGVLAEYQHHMVQVIQDHGGSIDKFLGDGIMATFGVTERSESYAADALRALEQALALGADWTAAKRAEGMPCPEVNGAVATGEVMFGAVGDATRLEYTVIGDAVNLSAKLEQHNKALPSRALTDAATFDLACAQGYAPAAGVRRLEAVEVTGLDQGVDLVVLLP